MQTTAPTQKLSLSTLAHRRRALRGSMGALMAAEALAAVARTVLDSFNSDCKAELLRSLQQEKDAKPDTIATHDGNR